MKKLSFIFLGILFLVQLAVPFSMIRDRENTLRNGELFKFKTRPIDPADPFQGRYVWLGYEDDYILWPEGQKTDLKYKESVYVILETDSEGFANLTDWNRTRPTEGHYLKTRYMGIRSDWDRAIDQRIHKGLRFDLPFDRFYMEETKAPRAEDLARDATRTTNCWAEVRVLEGTAVLEDVMVAGRSISILAAEKE